MTGNLNTFSVISTAENALRRLKKAEIGAFNCKKQGAEFLFSVKDKDVEKVFAIFNKPCYNIKAVKRSKRSRLKSALVLRAGLVAGAVMFVALALFANTFVLKIEVGGNGSYLEPEVRRIVYDEGAREFRPYSSLNVSVATGKILALPQVTFCNISRCGSVLKIDVQVDDEQYGQVKREPLLCDGDGIVRNIVAICGTAAVAAGDEVRKGDVLIYAYTVVGEETVECIAAGYAEIECRKTLSYFADGESEENLAKAYAAVLLEEENVLTRSYTVQPADGGVNYLIEYTCLHKVSINFT